MGPGTRSDLGWRLLIAVSAVASAIFIYPLVHELGHLVAARWFDADVGEFIWTPIQGNPHVSLDHVSAEAMPWVDAGGVLLPSIVGTVMMLGWIIWLHRLRLCFALVLVPAAMLLLGNLGLLFEASTSSGYHHMRRLAQALVGDHSAVATVATEIAPAVVSAILITAAVWRFRSMQRHARR